MRATLTDDGCIYEGDTTPAPGLFDIEVENKTSHLAVFSMWALADGKNVEDVQHAFEQARPAFEQGQEPKPGTFDGLFARGGWRTVTNRQATNILPANESGGRFVIACFVHASDGPLATDNLPLRPPSTSFRLNSKLASPLSPL